MEINEPHLLDKIYTLLSQEIPLPDAVYSNMSKKKGRKKTHQWRDDHSAYLLKYLNMYCSILTDNDKYRFIFSFMKITGFPFTSLKTDTDKSIADRVRRALDRTKQKE